MIVAFSISATDIADGLSERDFVDGPVLFHRLAHSFGSTLASGKGVIDYFQHVFHLAVEYAMFTWTVGHIGQMAFQMLQPMTFFTTRVVLQSLDGYVAFSTCFFENAVQQIC